MGRSFFTRLVIVTGLTLCAMAQRNLVPTTTLAQESGNNTSTADNFQAQNNGNQGPSNISKQPIAPLLYPGATTQIYAHLMGWFGTSSHMNVGYNSSDPAQVHRQFDDMASRGISGAILDWYGPENRLVNATAQAMRNDAEGRNGNFSFAIMEDGGALYACAHQSGCDVTQKLINDLNYAVAQYAVSGAYMRSEGRPVFFFFGDEAYNIDWTRARAGVNGNPLFIFRNDRGFGQQQTAGAYGWVAPEDANRQDPMALRYLTDFFWNSNQHPDKMAFGSAYKGFNDTLAPWGSDRIVTQNCGQTWMQSLARSGSYYSAAHQLNALQLVTWNDYEEGTAIEMGIDNCVSISSSVSRGVLNWAVSGNENTIDHYAVFISSDGQNLMKLTDVASGNHSLNVGSYDFAPGHYSLLVKAIGMATLKNQMSAPAAYTVNAPLVVAFSAPTAGSTTSLRPTISAAATGGNNITGMQLYVDNTLVGQSSSATVTATATVTSGVHTLTAVSSDGNGDTGTKSITVTAANLPPIAVLNLSLNNAPAGSPITASTSGSNDPDGNQITSSIDWGDGTTTSGSGALHAYRSRGTYTVTATITDAYGATATATRMVVIGAVVRTLSMISPTQGQSSGRNGACASECAIELWRLGDADLCGQRPRISAVAGQPRSFPDSVGGSALHCRSGLGYARVHLEVRCAHYRIELHARHGAEQLIALALTQTAFDCLNEASSLAGPLRGPALVCRMWFRVPKWRNWQTRLVQVQVLAREWGFESLLRHHPSSIAEIFLTLSMRV